MRCKKFLLFVGPPGAMTVLTVVSGMAFSLLWPDVVRHHGAYWITPGDMWDTFRAAHYVGWGGMSYVYSSRAVFVTLPAFATLLWPIASLSSALHLTESAPGIMLLKPQAWLLVGPFCLVLSGIALFGLDAVARRIGVKGLARIALLLVLTFALWPATAMWGHPEDTIAVGLLAFALVAALDGRWALAGWLLGTAIAVQLVVLLVVPIFIGLAGARRAVPLLARAAIVPGFFAVAVLVPDFHHAVHVLLQQPTYPKVDHATPWVSLSPVIAPGTVAAGPSRLLAGALALGAGWYAARRRGDLLGVLYAAEVVFAARCIFESVMVPYYVMPAVALALVVSTVGPRARLGLTWLSAIGLTVMTHYHMETWTYYGYMVALLAVMLIASAPRRRTPVPKATELLPTAWVPTAAATLITEGGALADFAG